MKKRKIEMSELAKYKFKKYDKRAVNWFKLEKKRLDKILGRSVEIAHIGSTAVKGLGGKGMLDILVAYGKGKKTILEKKMTKNKYICIKLSFPVKRTFFEKDYVLGKKTRRVHIHLVPKNSGKWEWPIRMVKLLNNNPKLMKEYNKIKKKASKYAKGDRMRYKKIKDPFIEKLAKIKAPKITTIIFDVGGVQYFWDHKRSSRPMSKFLGISERKIFKVLARGSSKPGFGRMAELAPPEKQYWTQFAKELKIDEVDPKRMTELWNKIFWPNKPMLKLIPKLAKNYKIGILSNMGQGHKKFLQKKGIEKNFKKKYIIWSCDVNLVKPNTKTYKLSLKRMNSKPEETIFVDDFIRNIKAARKIHEHGIVYKNHKKFLKELKKLGVKA